VSGPVLPPPIIQRLPAGPWAGSVVQALRAGALVARADTGVLQLEGKGAVACVQGLFTNDIEKPGDGAFAYGALLTPKGMVIVDGWAERLGAIVRFTVPTPGGGPERALAIFTRSVPPRLASSVDRSQDLAVLRVTGAHALAIAEAARIVIPATPGRTAAATVDGVPCQVSRASEGAPFQLQITTAATEAGRLVSRFAAAGALDADVAALDLARILAGWPGLTSEVDDHTLPQEIRLDTIGGVSYTKGCYTGQETVSRLHFRGHANRGLVGLEFSAEPAAAEALSLEQHANVVGRVTSVAWLPDGGTLRAPSGRWIGLGIVRHEVIPGEPVRTGGVEARVVELPFALPRWEPA
jgi:folate-binding protein YgfZ